MHRFISWLRGRGTLTFDPMAELVLPPPGDPLCHYLEVADVIQLADSLSGQHRLFEYLLPGTAMEVTTALTVRVRDVSKLEMSIHAAGTKTHTRNRVVPIAEFAQAAALELLKGKHPDTRLFDQIHDRWRARDEHAAAVKRLIEQGHRVYGEMAGGVAHEYTLRDHRHTWAVRAVRSAWPLSAVSEVLGHADGGVLVLKVYGRFRPTSDERKKWEAQAAVRDRAMAKDAKRTLRVEGKGQ
jgi:integrase